MNRRGFLSCCLAGTIVSNTRITDIPLPTQSNKLKQRLNCGVVGCIDGLHLHQENSNITGLSTGFCDFDSLTSGLQPSELIIAAARPSMGLYSFANSIVKNVVIEQRIPVVLFSLETTRKRAAMGIISAISSIAQYKVLTGKLAEEDKPHFTLAMDKLKDAPLFIDDTRGLTGVELSIRARRLYRQYGKLGLIVIDNLQQILSENTYEMGGSTNYFEVLRNLNSLASELNVPILVLSEVKRDLENRVDKRPEVSDLCLRESIQYFSDLIVFIYRDEVYSPNSPDKEIAEIIIRKNRSGPCGSSRFKYTGQYARLDNHT